LQTPTEVSLIWLNKWGQFRWMSPHSG
jgi:hypothetical protein